MREQGTRVKTGAVRKMMLAAAALVLAAAALTGGYRLMNPPYVPPAFDPAAVSGVPAPPENMGYGEISAQGGFSFSIAGTMYQQEDGSLALYLTNPAAGGINLMCEVANDHGEIIYKSGVLRPGEYVEKLQPLRKLPNEAMKIEVSVYAFEPETWYSRGTIALANILQPY